jgi:predicted negative regulator of RcsB-dependent stress response
MKIKVLVKEKIIVSPYVAPVLAEDGSVITEESKEVVQAGNKIDESGILSSQQEVDFFISQRPQYVCEVVDASNEYAAAQGLEYAKKAMECGKSAQALMLVRNAAKNLTTEQVKQIVATYAPIKALLDTGSLQSAVEEIGKIQADGVLVTEEDKAAITAHIGQCKP